jgi:toxin CcdB
MRQFDVYPNPNPRTREAFPYIVDIQSQLISELSTRIVIPLGRRSRFGADSMKGLTPAVEYAGEQLLLLTPQIASVPAKLLQDPIGSLEHFRADIIAALDFAVSGV